MPYMNLVGLAHRSIFDESGADHFSHATLKIRSPRWLPDSDQMLRQTNPLLKELGLQS